MVQKRNDGKPTEYVFGKVQRELLSKILEELNLKHDCQSNKRIASSIRHTDVGIP